MFCPGCALNAPFFEGLARLNIYTFATLRDKLLFLRERVLYSDIAPGRFSG